CETREAVAPKQVHLWLRLVLEVLSVDVVDLLLDEERREVRAVLYRGRDGVAERVGHGGHARRIGRHERAIPLRVRAFGEDKPLEGVLGDRDALERREDVLAPPL